MAQPNTRLNPSSTAAPFRAHSEVPVPAPTAIKDSDYSAAITAWATVALVLATGVLAYLTWVLARATRRASIVVTIEPNPAAINFLDMHIFNEGNVAAYDIQIKFDPPIPESGGQFDSISYPSKITMFSAGQRLVSSLCEASVIIDSSYKISINWRSHPKSSWRQSVSYDFDLSHLKTFSTLGKDPAIQSADEIKKIREVIERVASGRSRIRVDAFSQDDRDHERARSLAERASFRSDQRVIEVEERSNISFAQWLKPVRSLAKWIKVKLP